MYTYIYTDTDITCICGTFFLALRPEKHGLQALFFFLGNVPCTGP